MEGDSWYYEVLQVRMGVARSGKGEALINRRCCHENVVVFHDRLVLEYTHKVYN